MNPLKTITENSQIYLLKTTETIEDVTQAGLVTRSYVEGAKDVLEMIPFDSTEGIPTNEELLVDTVFGNIIAELVDNAGHLHFRNSVTYDKINDAHIGSWRVLNPKLDRI